MRIHPVSLLLPLCLGSLASATAAQAQTTFSVDHVSASDGDPDCTGNTTVEAGDILYANLLGGKPALAAPAPVCVGVKAGTGAGTLGMSQPLLANIDALSYGNDARVGMDVPAGSVWFSVTRSSRGLAQPTIQPSVRSEFFCGDQGASVFVDLGLPTLPANWAAGSGRHVEAIDGDGYASCNGYTAPGLGLIEPEPAGGGVSADDLDALDVDQPGGRVYFSLDGPLTDLCDGVTGNDSASSEGVNPGDILVSDIVPAGAPAVWAPAAALGLDRFGAGTDDLDALAIWDNGNGIYNPLELAFEWLGGTADMVLFSVRNGSAVIGAMDSISGSPIEAGDVLVPPFPGGLNGNPGILIPAEALGLATIRSAHGYVCMNAMVSDDLNALDTTDVAQFDCNGNGVEDALDIVFGTSSDADSNGIPDECQPAPRKILRSDAPSGSSQRRVNLR